MSTTLHLYRMLRAMYLAELRGLRAAGYPLPENTLAVRLRLARIRSILYAAKEARS